MTSDEALHLCQAYLDGELDPLTVANVDAVLARDAAVASAFAEQRKLHAFLKERSACVDVPPALIGGIQARLAREQTGATITPLTQRTFSRRGWIAAAASVALLAGAGSYWHYATRECAYMLACAAENDAVVAGTTPLLLDSEDSTKLAAFVSTSLKIKMPGLPVLAKDNLMPCGAGLATFASLKKLGSPEAAYVMYETKSGEKMTLFIHPWPGMQPEAFNKTEVNGHTYWAATHHGKSIATWKTADDRLVLSLVSSRSKDETLRIAEDARVWSVARVEKPLIPRDEGVFVSTR